MTSFLEKLFEGPGAANGISWVCAHHADKLDDIGLTDWLYGIKNTAATGAYRASPGERHTVGEERVVPLQLVEAISLLLSGRYPCTRFMPYFSTSSYCKGRQEAGYLPTKCVPCPSQRLKGTATLCRA